MLTSEVAVVKSHHVISVKCSRYRDTRPTDPSLDIRQSFYNFTLLFDMSQKFCNNASVFLLMFLDKCKLLIEYRCVTESVYKCSIETKKELKILKKKSRCQVSRHDVAHLHPLTNVPTK